MTSVFRRLLRADQYRKSRFHTQKGDLCLNPVDLSYSAVTTLDRLVTGRLRKLPWIVQPAIRYLRGRVDGLSVFEFGGGMSTLWYADVASRVVTIEEDRDWCDRIKSLTGGLPHVRIEYIPDKENYCEALSREADDFDVVVIDGSHRVECMERSIHKLRKAKYVVVDNTDADPILDKLVDAAFRGSEVLRFVGYAPGQLHPNETKIVVSK